MVTETLRDLDPPHGRVAIQELPQSQIGLFSKERVVAESPEMGLGRENGNLVGQFRETVLAMPSTLGEGLTPLFCPMKGLMVHNNLLEYTHETQQGGSYDGCIHASLHQLSLFLHAEFVKDRNDGVRLKWSKQVFCYDFSMECFMKRPNLPYNIGPALFCPLYLHM
ncbi:hypothetical protein BTVI_144081 [Pitangus sulphuratus]|nr:hypothetical protein BTVI_144081 [Pitangus sulphuratus]